MRIFKYCMIIVVLIIISGCAAVILRPADFSWPIENAIKINEKGFIKEDRYTFSVNVKPIFYEEFKDSNLALGKEIRIIRSQAGYYFLTASNFKNVYVLIPVEGGMKLINKIKISETEPLTSPAFNQKSPNIELIDGNKKYLLNHKGIVR
ncbi:hypothetical protein VJY32_07900 [Ignavibacteria bacterium 4148-Me]|uniref:hypothetical protein n=1 Tax=Rosettibacter primus TaxID=3111523 RepID=UPI00336BDE53